MRNAMTHSDTEFGIFSPLFGEVRSKWGWFAGLGIALLVLGMLALSHVLTATIISVLYIGSVMIIGAVTQILIAVYIRSWGGFFYWLLSGLFYGAAGAFALYNPALAATALTLLLAASLIVSGAVRMGLGARLLPLWGWGWLVASGVVSCLAGILIAMGWPTDAQWVLGLWLATDLTFQGASALIFGLMLKTAS